MGDTLSDHPVKRAKYVHMPKDIDAQPVPEGCEPDQSAPGVLPSDFAVYLSPATGSIASALYLQTSRPIFATSPVLFPLPQAFQFDDYSGFDINAGYPNFDTSRHYQHQLHHPYVQQMLPATTDNTLSAPRCSSPRLERKQDLRRLKGALTSPFKDCVHACVNISKFRFAFPIGGAVDGYVKFRCSSRQRRHSSDCSPVPFCRVEKISDSSKDKLSTHDTSLNNNVLEAASICTSQLELSSMDTLGPVSTRTPSLSPLSSFSGAAAPMSDSSALTPDVCFSYDTRREQDAAARPKLTPPQFGSDTRMDNTDRKFWEFCTFCLHHLRLSSLACSCFCKRLTQYMTHWSFRCLWKLGSGF